MNSITELNNSPQFQLITEDSQLDYYCQLARQHTVVALDTEFVRIRTFYPKLGLIQMYDGEHLTLIIPDQIKNFSPFIALLADPNVNKVLHACSEDLEVLQHYFQQQPTPMWDTQIMATFLKFPMSTGLATLLKHYFQLELDKGASRTDWLARPLSKEQLTYAAADVWYLLPLFNQMQQELNQTSWAQAAEWECQYLLQKRQNAKVDPNTLYINLPHAWTLNSIELARLRELAKWRYQEAIKRDLALNFVVKGENLYLLAKHNPKHTSQLLELGFSPNEIRIHGKKMLNILSHVEGTKTENLPSPIVRLVDDPRYKPLINLLQKQLKQLTPESLDSGLIASKRSIESLLKWVWFKHKAPQQLPDLLQGWRREIGLHLLAMIEKTEVETGE